MARLNIEDKFMLEIASVAALKQVNPDLLAGNAIRFFRYAQEKHKEGAYLTEDEFKALGFMEELFPMFARRAEHGISCAGAEKFFGWLSAKVESGRRGGSVSSDAKKSAAKKREKSRRGITDEKHKRTEASTSEIKQAQPSSSSSSSSSSSNSSSCSFFEDSAGLKEPQTRAVEAIPSPTALVWQAYKKAYGDRYRADPTWNAKVAGQIKQFTARVPADDAPEIAAFYLSHNSSRYVNSGHAVGQMLMDAEKLRTEWQTGNKITSADARSAEFGDSLKNQLRRLGGGT